MRSDRPGGDRVALPVQRVARTAQGLELGEPGLDAVVAEEPLEIRVEGISFLVTLRTPGHDLELAAGALLSEGVIADRDDLVALAAVDDPGAPRGNTVDVRLAPGVPMLREAARARYASSACGLCGKEAIAQIFQRATPVPRPWRPEPALLLSLPAALREAQELFAHTGGNHAAALFDAEGALEVLREDVGRHNAVDKVLGWRLLADRLPVEERVLLVSGRVGFEIVQKAAMAGVPALAAIGAPTTMAVELAGAVGMTLVGFLRDGRYNIY